MTDEHPPRNRPVKSLLTPDERVEADRVWSALVNVGGMTIGRDVHEPGWRWSVHVKPVVGGTSCQVSHLGVVMQGHLRVELDSGEMLDFLPWDVMDIPPGHDGWVVGDEPVETIVWRGARTWLEPLASMTERTLTTILFTDLVDSTGTASRVGDRAWGDLLASHDEITRGAVLRYRGRLVKQTGDGILAIFDSSSRALRCATTVREGLLSVGLICRAALNTGEIEITSQDVRGIAVHEAARMLAWAGPGEIVVADTTHGFVREAGLELVERGEHELRGLPGRYRLWSLPRD